MGNKQKKLGNEKDAAHLKEMAKQIRELLKDSPCTAGIFLAMPENSEYVLHVPDDHPIFETATGAKGVELRVVINNKKFFTQEKLNEAYNKMVGTLYGIALACDQLRDFCGNAVKEAGRQAGQTNFFEVEHD